MNVNRMLLVLLWMIACSSLLMAAMLNQLLWAGTKPYVEGLTVYALGTTLLFFEHRHTVSRAHYVTALILSAVACLSGLGLHLFSLIPPLPMLPPVLLAHLLSGLWALLATWLFLVVRKRSTAGPWVKGYAYLSVGMSSTGLLMTLATGSQPLPGG
ncbi:hypothetical protein SAMN05216570_2134 [Dyella sp. OK004]|uniref:hypothetical protein n=1 Tax=Dyella sp. OK004 TaxID=1855292 RepID=UPI0008E34B2F|nr:hypothetical protein [Dyella sp. OK004]SFS06382.1 hypothetical protein SAMN05216570_2134 [Dyella sp. OK004]